MAMRLYLAQSKSGGRKMVEDTRISWDEYFMEMAKLAAKRSTCLRRQVGAVIVQDKHVIATGYNGAPKGIPHCAELGGCYREQNNIPSGERHELCRALHAEQNAIIQAATYSQGIEGATMYITHQPCVICAKMIINAGIERIVVNEGYPDQMAVDILEEAGLKIVKIDNIA
ncbi:MAG: dCMP deaminase family protein [Firmicutes bacterium]|nr:dCMP deaminase family protein [Bacillota bacterium]